MSNALPQTIGIDISKKHLDAHAHPCGDARQFANTAPGFAALLKWTGQWQVERIAYEATGIYHRALEQALASFPLVRINPLRARRFAQATGTLAKTDRIDAGILARMAATLQPDVRPVKGPELAQLAELMNARDGLVRDRTALKNREKNLLLPLLKRQAKARLEPRRDCRRLQLLRRWSPYEQDNEQVCAWWCLNAAHRREADAANGQSGGAAGHIGPSTRQNRAAQGLNDPETSNR